MWVKVNWANPSLKVTPFAGGLMSKSSCIFEPTCADARWAHMHHFLSVHMSGCDWTKNQTRK